MQLLQPRNRPLRVRMGCIIPLLPLRLRRTLLPSYRTPRALSSTYDGSARWYEDPRRWVRCGWAGKGDCQVRGRQHCWPEQQ